jgi:aminoglycoside 3-N-acetyltransferase I
MNVTIKKLAATDLQQFIRLIHIFQQVFEWENKPLPRREYLQGVLDKSDFMVFVLLMNHEVIGGLTAHVLAGYDSEKPSAYIYDVAVAPDFQRKGFGKKLMAAFNVYCSTQGFKETFVQAETGDEHAVQFYRGTAVTMELPAIQFVYSNEH